MKKIIKTYNQSAFTLIELLVVITIIGILIALGTSAFISAQKSARDTQRKNDLRQYQIALENYASKNSGFYPGGSYDGNKVANTGIFSTTGPLNGFLDKFPEDPRNESSSGYNYYYRGGGTTDTTEWVLQGRMESGSACTWEICSNGKSGEKSGAADSCYLTTYDFTCDL